MCKRYGTGHQSAHDRIREILWVITEKIFQVGERERERGERADERDKLGLGLVVKKVVLVESTSAPDTG